MPVSTVTYTANGSTNQFSITFPYIDTAHVLVSVNGSSASFTFHNSTTVQLSSTPTSGQTVVVYRQTPSSALVDFTDGSTLFESDLDLANTQARYLSEEARDRADSAITTVTANKANIDTVAGIAGNVTTVAGANANIATVAGANSNITTVVGNLTNIDTVAGINSNISSVAGNASNITAVANDATDIGVVAGKATEISALGTSANITNMATLGATGVVGDIATVAGVASTMSAAATNASNAASSATAAANSAAAAAASFDTFDDRYLGSKSSEPSVDNDGNALVSGSLFFDSSVGSMKVYDGGNWILATSAGAASLLDYEFTATAGQTTFSGSDNNSATLSYAVGNLIVSLNGIILDNGSDYTATSGTSIVLASGAAAGDHLAVVAFKSFTVADTVPASTGGTFGGNVTVSGTVNGRNLATDGTKLDGIAAGATNYVHPTGAGNNHIPTGGSADQVLTYASSGTAAWADLNAGFLTNVINVTTSGETVLTASQSGSLVNVTNSGAIIKLPTAAAGIYFGIINTTASEIVVRATGSGVFGNGVLMPVPLSKATGLGLYIGIDSTHWALNYDTSSANVVHRFSNGTSYANVNNYSATFTTSAAATGLLLLLHSGKNYAGYGSGGAGYSNSPQGGIGYGEKLITSSLPSTLTIAGDYMAQNSTNNNPTTASRLTVTGTGVNIYTQRGTGGYSQTYSGSIDATGGTVVGCDFAAAGGQGRANSNTGYNNSSSKAIGGAGAGSPAGTGGRPASSDGTTSTFILNNGTQWVGSPSGIKARHAGGSGGNDGTTTAGGASATRDSNSISMIPYVGKEFYCPAGGINTHPTAEGYDSGQIISGMNTQKGPTGSNFGNTPSDLIYLFGAGNWPLFTGASTGAAGGGPWGNTAATHAQCVIIELKG